MATATNVQVKDWRDGNVYYDWMSKGTVIAGYGYNNQNWVTAIKFTIESYTKTLSLTLTSGGVAGSSSLLNYKLCTSEDSTYFNATYATASDGTIQPHTANYTPKTFALNTGYIAPGTYYLFLWTSKETSTKCYREICHNANGYVTITYTEATPLSTLSANNGTLGTAQTLTITSYDDSFTHSIRYDCGATSAAIVTKVSDRSISFTPSINLSRENTTGTSVSITFTLYTFDGDTEVGATTKAITCAIPASVVPSCSLQITDALGYSRYYGGYIQNKSKLEIIVTPTLAHDSPITAYTVTADGKTYNYSDIETTPLVNSGTLTVTATVRDSRARTGSTSEDIIVLPYKSPAISKLAVHRCNEDGSENAIGNYCRVTYSFNIESLSEQNSKTIKLLYKKTSAADYEERALPSAFSATDATYIFAAEDAFSYDVVLSVADNFDTATRSTTVSTAAVLMHWGADGSSIAFGKISERAGAVEFGWPVDMNGNKVENVGTPTASGDAVPFGYAQSAFAALNHTQSIEKGGTGATTRMQGMYNLAFFGANPITSPADDTIANWRPYGHGFAWYTTAGCLTNQPSQYGFLIQYGYGNDTFQMWYAQAKGPLYIRSGNNSTWQTSWIQVSGEDVVVAQGTSGIWNYRKWSSGLAECWGVSTQTLALNSTSGSCYYANCATVAFPFTFTAVPSVYYSLGTGHPAWVARNNSSTGAASTTATGQKTLYSTTSRASASYDIQIYAVGTWK